MQIVGKNGAIISKSSQNMNGSDYICTTKVNGDNEVLFAVSTFKIRKYEGYCCQ